MSSAGLTIIKTLQLSLSSKSFRQMYANMIFLVTLFDFTPPIKHYKKWGSTDANLCDFYFTHVGYPYEGFETQTCLLY